MLTHVGRYEILETIGQGAMAIVYKAYDPKIDRTLAIKVLRPERCMDQDYRQRFIREARAVGILSHPNIVTIYDVGETSRTPYIAMELIEGETLESKIKANNTTMASTLCYWRALADALSFAHDKGIIHRDIKPSNILIDQTTGHPKITDFGIAHMENIDITRYTGNGEIMGTPQYMSPEQVVGDPVDARSDLFSLGVIMYQMVTGERPFPAETLTTLLFQIATENPPPVGDKAPDIPAALKQIIDKLLQKKPARRFQNGQQLATALDRVIKDVEQDTWTGEHSAIPLSFKWALIMGLVISLTMSVGAFHMHKSQYRTLESQTFSMGAALVKFIAVETAESVLSEDWTSIELFVQDVVKRQNFSYLHILDHNSIVRGSSQILLTGKQLPASPFVNQLNHDDVTIKTSTPPAKVFNFSAPILFQNATIGEIHLGLSQQPLSRLSNSIITTLLFLVVVTLSTAIFMAWLMGKLIAQRLTRLETGLQEIGNHRYSYRISSTRQDEIGRLYTKFDQMADAIQRKDEEQC